VTSGCKFQPPKINSSCRHPSFNLSVTSSKKLSDFQIVFCMLKGNVDVIL
jgi:hypothetical protein